MSCASNGVTGSAGRVVHAASSRSVPASRHRPARDRRRCGRKAQDVEARDKTETNVAADSRAIGRLQSTKIPQNGRRHPIRSIGIRRPAPAAPGPPPTAAPEPPDEPPVIRVTSCGWRDGPSCTFLAGEVVGVFAPYQRPDQTAPAASMRSIRVASRGRGARSRLIFDPARVGRPCTSNRFYRRTARRPAAPDFAGCYAASMARAFARARSAVTSVNEFNTGSCLAIRASAASSR